MSHLKQAIEKSLAKGTPSTDYYTLAEAIAYNRLSAKYSKLSKSDREDVLSDWRQRFLKNYQKIDPDKNPKAFLHKMLDFSYLDYVRKNQSKNEKTLCDIDTHLDKKTVHDYEHSLKLPEKKRYNSEFICTEQIKRAEQFVRYIDDERLADVIQALIRQIWMYRKLLQQFESTATPDLKKQILNAIR